MLKKVLKTEAHFTNLDIENVLEDCSILGHTVMHVADFFCYSSHL